MGRTWLFSQHMVLSACVIHVTTVRTRSSKTAAQSKWLHQTAQLIYTRVQLCCGEQCCTHSSAKPCMGSLWGNECVQDDSATVIVPVFESVGCFDVIIKDSVTVFGRRVRTKSRDYTGWLWHGNTFSITGTLWRELTNLRWIPYQRNWQGFDASCDVIRMLLLMQDKFI